jgi:hypothetical protein
VTELALLGPAQRSLPRDPARALELVRDHERAFPRGRLREEREVIAIEALARLGQASAAQARYERFERQFPESVHRARLSSFFERRGSGP